MFRRIHDETSRFFGRLIANLDSREYLSFVRSAGRYLDDSQNTASAVRSLSDSSGVPTLASIDRGIRTVGTDPGLRALVRGWWEEVQGILQLGAWGETWRTLPNIGTAPPRPRR